MSRVKDELIGLEDAGVEDAFVEYDTQGCDDYDPTDFDRASLIAQETELDMYGDLTYDDWF